jgi:hypothetical protein
MFRILGTVAPRRPVNGIQLGSDSRSLQLIGLLASAEKPQSVRADNSQLHLKSTAGEAPCFDRPAVNSSYSRFQSGWLD